MCCLSFVIYFLYFWNSFWIYVEAVPSSLYIYSLCLFPFLNLCAALFVSLIFPPPFFLSLFLLVFHIISFLLCCVTFGCPFIFYWHTLNKLLHMWKGLVEVCFIVEWSRKGLTIFSNTFSLTFSIKRTWARLFLWGFPKEKFSNLLPYGYNLDFSTVSKNLGVVDFYLAYCLQYGTAAFSCAWCPWVYSPSVSVCL